MIVVWYYADDKNSMYMNVFYLALQQWVLNNSTMVLVIFIIDFVCDFAMEKLWYAEARDCRE